MVLVRTSVNAIIQKKTQNELSGYDLYSADKRLFDAPYNLFIDEQY
jgi:hypothetical protein